MITEFDMQRLEKGQLELDISEICSLMGSDVVRVWVDTFYKTHRDIEPDNYANKMDEYILRRYREFHNGQRDKA